jgi:hypothetical protein
MGMAIMTDEMAALRETIRRAFTLVEMTVVVGNVLTSPWITHPDPSTHAVLLYHRRPWNEIPPTNGADRTNLLKASRPVNINRTTGTIVADRT